MNGFLTEKDLRKSAKAIVKLVVLGAVLTPTAAWAQYSEQKVLASDGAPDDQFGFGVSVKGDVLAAGAPYHDQNGWSDSGAVYVYRRSGSGWTQEAKLGASDGFFDDRLGWSVAIEGDVLVAGAPYRSERGFNSGAAYVYRRVAGVWLQEAKLVPADSGTADQFGWCVSISGDTIVLGSPNHSSAGSFSGAAYVYRHNGATWSLESKLVAPDAQPVDSFGTVVAVDGDRVALSSPGDDDNGIDSGSAYVFGRSGTSWSFESKVKAADGNPYDYFGLGLDLAGDLLISGAPYDSDLASYSGSAYVFRRGAVGWAQEGKLSSPNPTTFENLGFAVAIAGNNAFVGSYGDGQKGDGAGAGRVYAFDGGSWSHADHLTASDGQSGDGFGWWVDFDGASYVSGAIGDDGLGSVYVLSPQSALPPLANAGPDQDVDGSTGSAMVTLDASGSGDPDSTSLTYVWTNGSGALVATGLNPSVTLNLGSHVLTLTVTDPEGNSSTDTVVINVRDLEAPVISGGTATPNLVLQPNHKMVEVVVSYSVSDSADPNPTRWLTVTSSEADSGLDAEDLPNDIQIVDGNKVRLRAERYTKQVGRTYTITIHALDASGNESTKTVTVSVPHGKKK